MSWFVNAPVTDSDTTKLVDAFSSNYPNALDSVREQFEFCLETVNEAFIAEVVDGTYTVSIGGHSNPDVAGDRKSLNISFSPVTTSTDAVELEPGDINGTP